MKITYYVPFFFAMKLSLFSSLHNIIFHYMYFRFNETSSHPILSTAKYRFIAYEPKPKLLANKTYVWTKGKNLERKTKLKYELKWSRRVSIPDLDRVSDHQRFLLLGLCANNKFESLSSTQLYSIKCTR